MKKFFSLSLALLMLLSLAACGSSGLSEEYNEAEVLARAEELVLLINTLDYEAVCGQLREDLSGAISPEELENAWGESLEKAGAFVEFKSAAAASQESKSTGENYAVAVLVCKYENASLTYTISMDMELNIVGMYMK